MPDIVIPVLNEEAFLKKHRDYYLNLKSKARLIFVDGGSIDQTAAIAKTYGEVYHSRVGRAFQKNAGAEHCIRDFVLFLHVDTFVSSEMLLKIDNLSDTAIVGGCATMKIKDSRFIFRVYEWAVNRRARNKGIFDGDLGMFVRKSVFDDVGQFDRTRIMEDIIFSKKLIRQGPFVVLPDVIEVSSRKWKENGFFKTLLTYSFAYIQLWLRIPFFKYKANEEKE